MPKVRGPWRKTLYVTDPVANTAIARSELPRPGPRPVQPDRLYSAFKEGYQLELAEREVVIQHLLEINICDMRLFKNIREFEQLQAERGLSRSS